MRWKHSGWQRPVEQFSDEWHQHIHIVLQKISWKWVCAHCLSGKPKIRSVVVGIDLGAAAEAAKAEP